MHVLLMLSSLLQLFPLLRTAHNASAEEGVKDAEVLAFCADPCGFRFTERAQAVLMVRR